ncbi:MAG: hypothetical protein Q9207_003859 [Kuettlingeria erythrocarpa]
MTLDSDKGSFDNFNLLRNVQAEMSTQTSFEAEFAKACSNGILPGVILAAANKSKTFTYSRSLGVSSSKDEHSDKPLRLDTVLWIASCTKLLTAIAALQLVEKQLLNLDEDVGKKIPELSQIKIITGWDVASGQPILSSKTSPITLRQLLSHSSGLGLDAAHPLLTKWRESRGEAVNSGSTVEERCNAPLLFEPGTSWMYGVGTSWTGKLIERTTGQTLEMYFEENILDPLGLRDVTFWPAQRSDMRHRMADLSMTDPSGGVRAVPYQGYDLVYGCVDCMGGGGLFASAQDFLAILHAVLAEDKRLLSKQSYQELLMPQLSNASEEALNSLLTKEPQAYHYYGMNLPLLGRKSWSLSGIVSIDEQLEWMGRNTVLWGGFPNIFIDREKDLCGLVAPQIVTLQDPSIKRLCELFQRGIYYLYSGNN